VSWPGPIWGEPSTASGTAVPLRAIAHADDAGYRADGGSSAQFVVLAASVAGVAHRLAGRRGEDAYAWAQPAEDRLALLVADGVSTAGRGGEGADTAVRAARDFLARRGGDWGEMACVAAMGAADEELERLGGPAKAELSTTLVVALVEAGGPGGARASLARVGDSTAFTFSSGEGWREVFAGWPEGEVLTATDVLPVDGVGGGRLETASVGLAEGTALVLVTDGIADPLRDGPTTVAPALAAVLAGGVEGELSPLALARAADFSRRGALDDRTLLVAWWRPRGGTDRVK